MATQQWLDNHQAGESPDDPRQCWKGYGEGWKPSAHTGNGEKTVLTSFLRMFLNKTEVSKRASTEATYHGSFIRWSHKLLPCFRLLGDP